MTSSINPLVGADAARPVARDADSIQLEVYFSAMQQQEARNRQDSATLREDRALQRLHAMQDREAQADAALWQQVRPLLSVALVDQVTAAHAELQAAKLAEGDLWVTLDLHTERQPTGVGDERRKWRLEHRLLEDEYRDATELIKQAQVRYEELASQLHQHFLALVREQRTLAGQRTQQAEQQAEALRRQAREVEQAANDALQAANRLGARVEQQGAAVIEEVIQ
ncbi:MAG: hypothetical protein M3R24_24910 [Chloroflexota bacterium]|nr:hypothetical protein [Chloroflexota bacterium]